MFISAVEDKKGHECARYCLCFYCQKQSASYCFVCSFLLSLEMGSYYVAWNAWSSCLILVIECFQEWIAFILLFLRNKDSNIKITLDGTIVNVDHSITG